MFALLAINFADADKRPDTTTLDLTDMQVVVLPAISPAAAAPLFIAALRFSSACLQLASACGEALRSEPRAQSVWHGLALLTLSALRYRLALLTPPALGGTAGVVGEQLLRLWQDEQLQHACRRPLRSSHADCELRQEFHVQH